MSVRSADQVRPKIKLQLPPMLGKDFLPNLELGAFAIDDQSIEIKDKSFDGHQFRGQTLEVGSQKSETR